LPSIFRATGCLLLIRVRELRLTGPYLDYADKDEVGEVASGARRCSRLACSESLMAGCKDRKVLDDCSLCNSVRITLRKQIMPLNAQLSFPLWYWPGD
jgi:hypothetical protein